HRKDYAGSYPFSAPSTAREDLGRYSRGTPASRGWSSDQLVAHGEGRRFGAGPDAELVEDGVDVAFDGAGADREEGADLPAGAAFEQAQDLPLAARQAKRGGRGVGLGVILRGVGGQSGHCRFRLGPGLRGRQRVPLAPGDGKRRVAEGEAGG